ncbi:AAA family ATPase [Sphaerisporangium perillae]|uniref:AAA family ATPase n=1 Tax=Sphaerisporangium perillae TaxID=2935860 RepID=UPI00200E44FE|nr:AAA family ATPase [Sphaerisporangium perillae]
MPARLPVREAQEAPAPRVAAGGVIVVDGPSGSGKTTLGRALAAELDATLVHMDDLYPGWDGLRGGAERLVEWILRPLAGDRPARWRRYDWTLAAYAEWHEVPRTRPLVVEGAGAGAAAAGPYISLLIWMEAPLAVRRARALERDGDTYRPHWERWARQEGAYFAADRVRDRADLVIDTTEEQDALAVVLEAGQARNR